MIFLMPLFTAFLSSNSLKQNIDVKFDSRLHQLKAWNSIVLFKNLTGGREVNIINTLSKNKLSKLGLEGGGSTSIWTMSTNILFLFFEVIPYRLVTSTTIGVVDSRGPILLPAGIILAVALNVLVSEFCPWPSMTHILTDVFCMQWTISFCLSFLLLFHNHWHLSQ